ncbi:MAG: hypothetical protein AAFO84_15530 [Cyanobacteria bacterium J06598_1]
MSPAGSPTGSPAGIESVASDSVELKAFDLAIDWPNRMPNRLKSADSSRA